MNKRIISITCILLLLVWASVLLAACGSASPASTPSAGQTLMEQRCTGCHSLNRVTSAHHTADEWKTTVDRMVNNGAQLSSTEEQTLIDYLAQNYK